MKSLLLTGGTGFFGKSMLDAYRRGVLDAFGIDRIIIVARRATRLRAEAPELCGSRIELVDSDVVSLESTYDADVIVHAAASSDVRRYQEDPTAEGRIVVEGARRVWELAAQATTTPRMLLVSSGAVYGRQPANVSLLREDTIPFPDENPARQAYAGAKRAAEETVTRISAHAALPTRIARCFAFVGRWLPMDGGFAVGNFLGSALRGEPVRVLARHPVIRSYLHADDLAVWLMTLAMAEGDDCGGVFNVGSGEAVSVREVAGLISTVAGVGLSLPDESYPAECESETADRYLPDVSKAQREFALRVTIPLEAAIERTLLGLSASPSGDGTGRSQLAQRLLQSCPSGVAG